MVVDLILEVNVVDDMELEVDMVVAQLVEEGEGCGIGEGCRRSPSSIDGYDLDYSPTFK